MLGLNRLITKVRVINSRLFIVYDRSVYSAQGDQKPTRVSRDVKKAEKLIDTNGNSVLIQKGDKLCVEELSTKASKGQKDEERKCVASTLQYLYPSGQGFWFLDTKQDKLTHLSSKAVSNEMIAAKDYQIVGFRGVTSNVAVQEVGTTELYTLKDSIVQRGDSIEKPCLADTNALFSAETNPVYWGLTCFRAGKRQGELEFDIVEIAGGKVKESVPANTITIHGHISQAWVSKSVGKTHPVLIAYKDGQYTQYNERGNQQWTRAPELENALDVLAADFPSEERNDEIPVYESFGKNIVGAFMYRVYADCRTIAELASTVLPKLANINFQGLINKITGKQNNEIGDLHYYNKYGLRKTLVFVTRHNKLVAVDSLNGQGLWTLVLKPSQTIEKATLNVENNIELVYIENRQKKRTVVRSLDGSFISQDSPVDAKASVFLQDPEGEGSLEAGFSTNYLKNAKSDFSFYRVVKDEGIFGYRWNVASQTFEEVWNYLVEPGQSILDYSYHLKGASDYLNKAASGSLSALPDEDVMYYKVVDSGNVALLLRQTVNGKDLLSVVIINTVRGKVLGVFSTDAADFNHSLGFVYDDNGVYVSYMNSRLGSFELWSIELLATRVENSFMEMIQTFVLGIKRRDDLDYHADVPQFVVLDRKYGLPFGLKYLGAVSTRHGLTKRNLIGITTTNDVSSSDPDRIHRQDFGFCKKKHYRGNREVQDGKEED